MTPTAVEPRFVPLHRALVFVLAAGAVALPAAAGVSGPSFTKVFAPDIIGPGSTSMLVFTITNDSGLPADEVAFTDVLPAGVTLAAPAFGSNSCGGALSAPDGGSTVSLTDGQVGALGECTVVVHVTAGAVDDSDTTYMNVSGALTSTLGSGPTATDDLTVDVDLPGFSKSFAPSTVEFGERSTLTFTIDNSANAANVDDLGFTDLLPTGMVVASPAEAATTCGTATLPPTLSAIPGSDTIILDAAGSLVFPALAAGAICTVTVDVVVGAVGSLGNVSGNLEADFVEAGKAAAVLEVTDSADLLRLQKEFTDDPVPPGGTVTLEFTVTNKSRTETATGIAFDDDLGLVLAGLAPYLPPTPDPPCGAGSSVTWSGSPPPGGPVSAPRTVAATLSLVDGTLPPEGSCTFAVELFVPPATAPGTYTNTTGQVHGLVGGSMETGNTASDLLFVVASPVFTKEFLDDPAAPGGTVTLRFTITNTDTLSALTGIGFTDDIGGSAEGRMGALPGLAANSLVAAGGLEPEPLVDPCGTGSLLTIPDLNDDFPSPPFPNLPPDPTQLVFTGGSLAAAGMPGDSCTFDVVLDVPDGAGSGTYLNTTSPLAATPQGGSPATDTLIVLAAPTLEKEFTDDPLLPDGGTVTLELTLSHPAEAPGDATAIAFTDSLAFLAGLTAASVDSNTCTGSTVDITTDPTSIDFSGGSLTPGSSCAVRVTLAVPMGSPVGLHTNTTSDVTATVAGLATTSRPAADDLLITPLTFAKEFTDDPVVAGGTVTLQFTLDNTLGSIDATGISFSDTLSAIDPAMTWTGSSAPTPCGATLAGLNTGTFSFTGGTVPAGTSCVFTIDVLVPAALTDDTYVNVTSTLGSSLGSVPEARDVLIVRSAVLELTKEFTDDPVLPGSTVTLEFTLTNLSTETVTAIAFSDNLGDAGGALLGLEARSPALLNDCGGMATLPATTFSYASGSLDGGQSCTIRLTLDVPPAPLPGSSFLNTTSMVTGIAGGLGVNGSAASDTLEVQLLTFSKSFDGPATATGTAELTFAIANLDTANPITNLVFSDDLDAVLSGLQAVLPPTPDPPCGPGSAVAGTSFLALTGGALAAAGGAGDSCTFTVTVEVPGTATAGTFVNTTSELFSAGLPVADPATANLEIEPPPTFAKEFSPDAIAEGEVSTLIFTIDNSASALAATGLSFTDNLPAGLVVATPSNKSKTCVGGMVGATEGSGTIGYGGGEIAAGASCTLQVDVTSDNAGAYVNVTAELTSSSGSSGTASDTLTVTPGSADLELIKAAVFDPVMAGRYQVYQLAVTNLGPDRAYAVTVDDVLPPGTTLVSAQPAALCSEAGGVVTCALGDLDNGESATMTLMAYVGLTDMAAPIENMATVSSDTTDPDGLNNDVIVASEVVAFTGMVALEDVDGSGFPDLAVPLGGSIDLLVKDVESQMAVHQTEVFPDGWQLAGVARYPGTGAGDDAVAVVAVETVSGAAQVRLVSGATGGLLSTSVLRAGFLPVSLATTRDDGTGRGLLVVGAVSTTGASARLFVFDAADGSRVANLALHPAAWPIDVEVVPSFTGDALVELAVLWAHGGLGGSYVQTKMLAGATLAVRNLPPSMSPLDLEVMANCCAGVADELAALGWDRLVDRARVRVIDAETGSSIHDGDFGNMAQPVAIAALPQVSGSSAEELVTLFRNAALRAAVRQRDGMTGANLLVKGFGPMAGSVPLALGVTASVYGTAGDEVAVYWLDPASGDRFVTVFDSGDGATEAKVTIP